MSITRADILSVAPEFRDVKAGNITDDDWTRVIADVDTMVNDNFLGATKGRLARMWLAAHYMAVKHPEISQAQKIRTYEDKSGGKDSGAMGSTRFWKVYQSIIKTMGAVVP